MSLALKLRSDRLVLGPRRQHDARELRVGRAIAAPARNRCEYAKDRALHCRRWRPEHDHVAELPRTESELQLSLTTKFAPQDDTTSEPEWRAFEPF
jgi:hypothetical protein